MKELLVGFNSAWANKTPDAIAAHTRRRNCRLTGRPSSSWPGLFRPSTSFLTVSSKDVDGVAKPRHDDESIGTPSNPSSGITSSMENKVGHSMRRRSRRSKQQRTSSMDARQQARTAAMGRFLIEVFPALALPAMIQEVWERHRAAKYNPVGRRFDLADWALVSSGLAKYARKFGVWELADWADAQAHRKQPRKPDQDRLDAAVCVAVAISWRRGSADDAVQLGDEATGYMVTPVSVATRAVLTRAAEKRGVPVDRDWSKANGSPADPSRQPGTTPPQCKPALAWPPVSAGARDNVAAKASARVDTFKLRELLVQRARCGKTITSGAAAAEFGFAWSQRFGASLKRALNALADENRNAARISVGSCLSREETQVQIECAG